MRDFAKDIADKGANMNRRALAKEIGISPTTLCRVAAGHMPDVKTCRKLAAWLCCDLNEYLTVVKDRPDYPVERSLGTTAALIRTANLNWVKSGIQAIGHE